MVRDTPPSTSTHQIWDIYLKYYMIYASDMIILDMRSEVKLKVIVTRKMVSDTSQNQDAPTLHTCDSYLK